MLISRGSPLPERSVIIDSPKVLVTFMVGAGLVVLAFIVLFGSIQSFPLFCILIALSAILFYRMVIIAQGFIVDIPMNKLFFPGGGIEANSWTDYLSPSWLLQGFQRRSINLDEIRSIQEYTQKSYYRDSNGRQRVSHSRYLEITGNFGAISILFFSKGKMDQLYAALANLNKMGIPVATR